MNDINFMDLVKIANSLKEDGALEREDAITLLTLLQASLSAIRPHIKKVWLSVALAGFEKVIEETLEHIEEHDTEEK